MICDMQIMRTHDHQSTSQKPQKTPQWVRAVFLCRRDANLDVALRGRSSSVTSTKRTADCQPNHWNKCYHISRRHPQYVVAPHGTRK
jgi:hypothetical protein